MKKTIKEEMLEAIEKRQDLRPFKKSVLSEAYFDQAATSCTSIAEKHIKIARLEGFIQGLKDFLDMSVTPDEITKLEQELEKLKKQ